MEHAGVYTLLPGSSRLGLCIQMCGRFCLTPAMLPVITIAFLFCLSYMIIMRCSASNYMLPASAPSLSFFSASTAYVCVMLGGGLSHIYPGCRGEGTCCFLRAACLVGGCVVCVCVFMQAWHPPQILIVPNCGDLGDASVMLFPGYYPNPSGDLFCLEAGAVAFPWVGGVSSLPSGVT